MTASTSSPIVQSPPKSSAFAGCLLTGLVILLAFLGMYRLIWGFLIAYVFSSANMFSLFNLGLLFIILCQALIYFFLAFRIKQQHWLLSVGLLAIVWLVLPILLYFGMNFSTARFRNDGYGMAPALLDQSYLLADRLAYNQKEPERGDIIIFHFPLNPEQDLIKRVIGLPGETVDIQDGKVTVNGSLLDEPYITEHPLYNGTWDVPEGQYFVLGDNRNDSRDSHSWGFLPRENIIAKVVWIYLPFENFGKIEDGNFPP